MALTKLTLVAFLLLQLALVKFLVVKTTNPTSQMTILLYTKYFGDGEWFIYPRDGRCAVDGCQVTYNKSLFLHSDFVLFHDRDLRDVKNLTELKLKRPGHQKWVYFNMETPEHSSNLQQIDKFDLVSTYCVNSFVRTTYGGYRKLSARDKMVAWRTYPEKTHHVAWLVSNCACPGRRRFAERLKNAGITVHVGGKCAKIYEGFEKLNCTKNTCDISKFRFYFAAENGVCQDYVTEKYWRSLDQSLVPIVLGGANYSDPDFAVPGSFINPLDFKDFQHFVEHLKLLINDDSKYRKYFNWKDTFETVDVKCQYIRRVCAAAKRFYFRKTYEKPSKLFNVKQCQKRGFYRWMNHV